MVKEVETDEFRQKTFVFMQIFFKNLALTIAMNVVQNQMKHFDFAKAT